MPTNDERREVAERLREKHSERQGTFEPQSMSIQAMNRLDDLLECLPKRRDMFLDLADLIEPEERTVTLKGNGHCPDCNRLVGEGERYCAYCGAAVTKVIR